jgi:hypothetical protein
VQFHEEVRRFGKNCKVRKFAFHHRDLVAAVISGTNAAVFIDFVGQVFTLGNIEPQLGKKLRTAREQANAAHLVLARL